MASILKVDQIGKTSGSTQDTMKGMAKAWATLDADASTVSVFDSFNVSSNSDDATGKYGLNFSNNMSNAHYMAGSSSCYFSQSNDYDRFLGMSYKGSCLDPRRTTSEIKVGGYDGGYADSYTAGNCVHGDLA